MRVYFQRTITQFSLSNKIMPKIRDLNHSMSKKYSIFQKFALTRDLWWFDFNAEFDVVKGIYVILFLTSVDEYKINLELNPKDIDDAIVDYSDVAQRHFNHALESSNTTEDLFANLQNELKIKMTEACKKVLKDYKENNDNFKEILENHKHLKNLEKKVRKEVNKTLKDDGITMDNGLKWDIRRKFFIGKNAIYFKNYVCLDILSYN